MSNLPRTAIRESLYTYNSKPMIKWCNNRNEIIGVTTRDQMRQNALFHRASYIFIRNTQLQYLVHKRAAEKDYCPSYYDLCVGGVHDHDDNSALINAIRELNEETGIKAKKEDFMMKDKYF